MHASLLERKGNSDTAKKKRKEEEQKYRQRWCFSFFFTEPLFNQVLPKQCKTRQENNNNKNV